MKHLIYKIKQYITITLAVSLVASSLPVNSQGGSWLAPAGGTELGEGVLVGNTGIENEPIEGDKAYSSGTARNGLTNPYRVRDLLLNWKIRPEPLELVRFSREDILKGMKLAFGTKEEEIATLENSLTFKELENLLPYMHKMAERLLDKFPACKILIAGRDAENFYDALKTLLAGTPRENDVMLFPGSLKFMRKILEPGAVLYPIAAALHTPELREKSYSKAEIEEFLSSFGITESSLKNGQKFVLFDTGFSGTVGALLCEAIKNLNWPSIDDSLIHKSITPILVGKHIAGSSNIYARELMYFSSSNAEINKTEEIFPKTMACLTAHEINWPFNLILAIAIQLLPTYHGQYAALTRDNGRLIGIPKEKNTINDDIDGINDILDINESIVNPVAAMLIQRRVIKYFQQKRAGKANKANSNPSKFSIPRPVVILNKPHGYISSTKIDPRTPETPIITDLTSGKYPGLVPVGRLDKNTSGIILFEKGTKLTRLLLEPIYDAELAIEKTYVATVIGYFTPASRELLKKGVNIQIKNGRNYWGITKVKTNKVKILNRYKVGSLYRSVIEIKVTGGKYHQIRQLLGNTGFPVWSLERVSFGNLELGDLPAGGSRELTEDEYRWLEDICNKRLPVIEAAAKNRKPNIYTVKRPYMHWENADIVPWHEVVHDPDLLPKGPSAVVKSVYGNKQNQTNLWANNKALRARIIDLFDDIFNKNMNDTTDLLSILVEFNKIILVGEDGDSIFITPDVIDRGGNGNYIRNISGSISQYYAENTDDLDDFLDYLMTSIYKFTGFDVKEADKSELLMFLADFYYNVNTYWIFKSGNKIIYHNLLNAMLRLHDLRGIRDFSLMTSNLTLDEFREQFFKEVRRYNPKLRLNISIIKASTGREIESSN